VGRAQFLLAKYLGMVLALTVLTYVNLVAALLASRMAFDAYGATDLFAVGVFVLGVLVAYLMGGFSNFFLRRPFVSDAVFSLVLMVSLVFVVISFYNKDIQPQEFAKGVDWRLIPAAVLVLFALWILAALALACSTRLDIIPTLAICSACFLLGIMSDYLFGRRAEPVWRYDMQAEMTGPRWTEPQRALLKELVGKYDQDKNGTLGYAERKAITLEDQRRLTQVGLGGSPVASVLYSLTPNWQLFWLADALDSEKSGFHWAYVAKALVYMLAYVGAVLAMAISLFTDRELS
jgi:hypothetical protein